MVSALDYGRSISSVTYNRDTWMAVVEFACTEDEIGDMLPGKAVCMLAWVGLSDKQEFDLKVTADDSRVNRKDVRERLVNAFNAAYGMKYRAENSEFIVDPKCMERRS